MKKFSLTKKGVYAFAYICAFVFVQMLFSCGNTDDLLQQVDLSSTDYRVSPKEAGDMALSIAIFQADK